MSSFLKILYFPRKDKRDLLLPSILHLYYPHSRVLGAKLLAEGRACFPEHFPEEGVTCEPVPDFENVPVGEFYQDAVPFQIERGFPHDAAAGEGVEHGFALPGHEL